MSRNNYNSKKKTEQEIKYEKLGLLSKLGVITSKTAAKSLLTKWAKNAETAKTNKVSLNTLFGTGKPCDIKILKACIKWSEIKLNPNEIKSLEALCDRNNPSINISTAGMKGIFNKLSTHAELNNAFLNLQKLLTK